MADKSCLLWRKVFHHVAALISDEGMEALKKGLEEDDKRLVQGQTTVPPPLMCVQDWPMEGGDAITYAAWKGDGLLTVGECEEFFARLCYEVDTRMGEPAGIRWFLNWHDETPRDEMRRLLLEAVITEIDMRRHA